MTTLQVLNRICLLSAGLLLVSTGSAQTVTRIAAGAGAHHSLFIKSDGSLWVMGQNQVGQLGDGTYAGQTNRPEQIVASGVTEIVAGYHHNLFIKSDGSLWAMGDDGYGQLGDGGGATQLDSTNRPEQIVASNVTAIAAGWFHSLFLNADGSLWGMGYNHDGELGDGTFTNRNRPVQIVASNVTAVAAGDFHSVFLMNDGSLWAMGKNVDGELGDGTNLTTNRPEKVVAGGVIAIAAGGRRTMFLKSGGSMWAMGNNQNGSFGDGTYATNAPYYGTNLPQMVLASNVTAIAAGEYHTLFLKSDGSLWGTGQGYDGELGDGNGTAPNYFGTNSPEQIVASGVIAIAAGWQHSLFLKNNGSLWAMGGNAWGQLGNGSYTWAYRPEQIVATPPLGYNLLSGQVLDNGNLRLSFVGLAGTNYALDRSFSISPANWAPQATNPTDPDGNLVFTNTADPVSNNFWRVRSVQ